jgi:hypothetical protein
MAVCNVYASNAGKLPVLTFFRMITPGQGVNRDAAASKHFRIGSGPFDDWLLFEISAFLNREDWLWYMKCRKATDVQNRKAMKLGWYTVFRGPGTRSKLNRPITIQKA